MTTHKVKSWIYLFQAVKAGYKKHDFRDMRDRDYKVGDTLVLQEYDQATGEYTGDEIPCKITYITDRQTPCAFSGAVLDQNYGVLSIEVIDDDEIPFQEAMTTYLLVDTKNAFSRAKHVVKADSLEEKVGMIMHVNLKILRKAWEKFEADHVVFCVEGTSWRYTVYPQYKSNRKIDPKDLTPKKVEEENAINAAYNSFVDFLQEKTNTTVLGHDLAEADDMIARWIATHPDDDHIIVSSDGDFVQLLDHNVKIFNGIRDLVIDAKGVRNDKGKRVDFTIDSKGKIKIGKTLLEDADINPVREDWIEYSLFTKIVRGDISDGITSAYPGVRQKGAKKKPEAEKKTKKKAVTKRKPNITDAFEDRFQRGFDWFNFMNQTWMDHHNQENKVQDRYEENEMLINLKMQPDFIMEAFDEYIGEQEFSERIPQVGIHFLRFANQYDLAAMIQDPNSIVEMLNARVS